MDAGREPIREPVTIVGAGPAGITAAIVLRKSGIAVRVYEKYPDVGYRLNGDFQGLENWSTERDVIEILKEIGIDINFLCVPYHGGIIHGTAPEPVQVRAKRPIFYLVRRGAFPGTLDIGLKQQAEALGVEFVFSHHVTDIKAKAIVGTGPQSADAIAIGMTFTTSLPDTAAGVFDDEIAPTSYAYLLVHNGYGTMATLLYSGFDSHKRYFRKMKDFFTSCYNLDIRNEKPFASYGNFFLRNNRVLPDRLYVGESAGFQDYLWGFGMRYAFLSGSMAAQSIMDGANYDLLWKKQLKPMLQTSIVNRYLVEMLGNTAYRYLTRKLVACDACEYLRRHYNYSLWKHLLLPFAKIAFSKRAKVHPIPVNTA